MKRCASALAAAVLLIGVLGTHAVRADAIDSSIKQSTNPAAQQQVVASFIATQVTALGDDTNPAGQSAAREALVGESMIGHGNPSSPEYLTLYTQLLNNALLPLVKNPKPGVRAKLNAAIVVSRVAKIAQDTDLNLTDVTTALLQQKSFPQNLWGLKAAASLVLASAKNPVHPNYAQLQGAINQIVAADTPGDVVTEAYKAAMAGYPDSELQSAQVAILTPDVLALLEKRINLYVQTEPENPEADSLAILFLFGSQPWKNLQNLPPARAGAAQPFKMAVQDLCDLIYVAGQRAAKAKDPSGYGAMLVNVAIATHQTPVGALTAPLNGVGPVSGPAMHTVCNQVSQAIRESADLGGPYQTSPSVKDAETRATN